MSDEREKIHPLLAITASAARALPMPIKRMLYRIGPLAQVIRSGLNRAAPSGLTEVRVAAGGLEGVPLVLDLQAEKDYWLGTYEPDLQAAISDLVKPGMVAYDVGANIGYISLLLSIAVGDTGFVYAFEALPENVDRLRRNLALSPEGGRVMVIPKAVTAASGPVSFFIGPSGGMGKAVGSAGRQEIHYARSITVLGTSLDEFVFIGGSPAPDVVKVDIEGGEVLALPGMQRILREVRPIIFIELHGPEAAGVVWDVLVESGYQVCRMESGYPGVSSREALNWKAYLVAMPL